MDSKKIRKSISRFAGWLGLNLCSLIISVMPGRWIYGFAEGLARLGYRIAAKQRKIALESLSIAFENEKTPREVEAIARDCFSFMTRSGAELMFFMDKPGQLKNHATFEGKKYLDAALARGRGVILVSAHFGNFPLLLMKLCVEGYTAGGIMRAMRDKLAESYFAKKRQRYGIKTIYSQPRKVCVEETIRSLRNNELIFIPLDQNFGTAGVFVDFFGTKAATATGPVIFAQRTKAALLPCFIVRQPDNTHKIIFEPELELQQGKTPQETIALTIQRLTDIIERYIREYPAEWGWIHRRWKSRPSTKK